MINLFFKIIINLKNDMQLKKLGAVLSPIAAGFKILWMLTM